MTDLLRLLLVSSLCGAIFSDNTSLCDDHSFGSAQIYTAWHTYIFADEQQSPNSTWIIDVPKGNHINFVIHHINVDDSGPNENCEKRFVLIKSIPCRSDNDVKKLCFKTKVQSLTIPSNRAEISYSEPNSHWRNYDFSIDYYAICGATFYELDEPFTPDVESTQECTWKFNISRHDKTPALLLPNQNGAISVIADGAVISTKNHAGNWLYPNTGTLEIHYRNTTDNSDINFELQYINIDHPCLNDVSPCLHGQCIPKNDVEYICACSKGYIGNNCTQLVFNGPVCTDESYLINNEAILWEVTKVGEEDIQDCPGGVTGKARRPCVTNENGQTVWGRPDLSGCVNQVVLDIAEVAKNLKTMATIDRKQIVNVTSSIAKATGRGINSTTKELFPGDLISVTDTVQTVAEIVKQAKDQHNDLEDIAQSYSEAIGSVIDKSVSPVWRLMQLTHVESKMASLLTSVSILAANVANTRMMSLSTRHRRELSALSRNLTINATHDNLEFSVTFHERVAMCNEMTDFKLSNNSSSSISLPADVFSQAVRSSRDQYIQIYTARYSSIANILKDAQNEESKHSLQAVHNNVGAIVNSDIVSGKVLNLDQNLFQDLQKQVVIVLELKNTSSMEDTCVFLNMTAINHERRWSSDGCIRDTSASNKTHTVCLCSHLTNFAVLLDVYDISTQLDDKNSAILTYLSYAGGGLSILCCIVAIIVFEFFRLKIERIRIHQQLAVAIVVVQVLFIGGIDRTENKYACMALAIGLHYALTSMFCWMMVEGIHLYVLLVKVFKRGRNFKKYLLLGWGIPLVIVGISAGIFHEEYGNAKVCWLSHKLLLIVFVPTVGLVILINATILMMVLRIMMKSLSTKANADEHSTIRAGLKAAAILLPLLGLTWTLAFLSVDNSDTLVFRYLFVLLNSLQGVFFFVFHCLLSVDVKKAYSRRSQRRSTLTWTNYTGSSRRKSSDTFYSNSKESINTVISDTSSMDRRKLSPVSEVDRIYRDPRVIDRYGFHNNTVYHDNLFRSRSDETPGIPGSQKKKNLLFDDLDNFIFYRGDSPKNKMETNRGQNNITTAYKRSLSSDIPQPTVPEMNIAELYVKPLKRESREVISNHVRFGDDESVMPYSDGIHVHQLAEPNEMSDPIRSTPRRTTSHSASTSSSGSQQTVASHEDFLRELKEKTSSFKEK